jgi:hypothetical protein
MMRMDVTATLYEVFGISGSYGLNQANLSMMSENIPCVEKILLGKFVDIMRQAFREVGWRIAALPTHGMSATQALSDMRR